MNKPLRLFFVLLIGLAPIATADVEPRPDIQLPELGDGSSTRFSLQQEHQLGRAWLRVFRGQVETVSDPVLQEYVEELTFRLASHSELKDRRLELVIVDNPAINAFAVPGGVVGINNGLILQAKTEAQFASVMAHELGHLSQRHFARGVEAQQRSTLPTLAGMLAGVILAATAGGDAGLAAITATQAAALQNRLRYSRLHEQEADRAGMQTLSRAGIDPNAAAGMFEVMQKQYRFASNRLPEFLLTHPITENRISDARNRARQYPRKIYTDSTRYQLMRARVEFGFIETSRQAVKRFRTRLNNNSRHPVADQYGLVLALTADGQYDQAQSRLDTLRKASPTEMAFLIAQADLYIASGQYLAAIELLESSLATSPGNHPLTMTLARARLQANQPHRAEALLVQHSQRKPNDPSVWYLLAEVHGLAGNVIDVHQARAEYFVLNGALTRAIKQLGYALPLVQRDHLATARIQERIRQINQLAEDMEAL